MLHAIRPRLAVISTSSRPLGSSLWSPRPVTSRWNRRRLRQSLSVALCFPQACLRSQRIGWRRCWGISSKSAPWGPPLLPIWTLHCLLGQWFVLGHRYIQPQAATMAAFPPVSLNQPSASSPQRYGSLMTSTSMSKLGAVARVKSCAALHTPTLICRTWVIVVNSLPPQLRVPSRTNR